MSMSAHPIVTIQMKNHVQIILELYPEEAPNTVSSFLHLARLGCFDHHVIERLAPDFVVDVSYTAYGKEEAKYLIAPETKAAGFPNHLAALPGTVVMGGYENGIAGGEFFFPLKENDKITWNYPAFGKVIEGMDEILSWNALPVKEVDFPLDPSVKITAPVTALTIRKVTVDTFGVTWPDPVKLENVSLPVNWGIH